MKDRRRRKEERRCLLGFLLGWILEWECRHTIAFKNLSFKSLLLVVGIKLESEARSVAERDSGTQKTKCSVRLYLVSSKGEIPNHLTSFMLNDLKRHQLGSGRRYTKMVFAALFVF